MPDAPVFAVLGAAGQLGRDLCAWLPGRVVALTRADADLTNQAALRDALTAAQASVVINCAAYNLVDVAESTPAPALAANFLGPRDLATVCRDLDCDLVHFSTDYVFGLDAGRTTPLSEDDPPGPVSVYGVSKLAGEYAVRTVHPRHYVVRTCGLYGVWGSGGKGTNFVETMLRLAGEGKPLSIVADQRCTPTYTADLADAVWPLVRTGKYGLYQLTSAGDCSWHEFAAEIFRQAGLSPALTATTSAAFIRPARRPPYSVMSNAKAIAAGVPALRHWRDALAAYLAERGRRHG